MNKAKLQRLITPYYTCYTEPGDGDGGEGGAGGGGEEKPPAGEKSSAGSQGLAQAEVDRIVKGRVEETRKSTREQVAKELGVSLEDAKKLIEAAQAASDAEKSEAQLAREAADREKVDAESAKTEAAKARHDANVERQLLRALPKDLDDDVLDRRVTRLGKLIEVETGADADAIKKAIDDLKKDDPALFGAPAAASGEEEKGKGQQKPPGDPKGNPPAGQNGTSAFERGRERAKNRATRTQYAFEKTS